MNDTEYRQAYVDEQAIEWYEQRLHGEEDDGDDLTWEYDPNVKENHK